MKDGQVQSVKIVATPTLSCWAQVYNAGPVFSVLSLEANLDKLQQQNQQLNGIGKKFFETLEQEYFTLETKNLQSIKQAVLQTLEAVDEYVQTSLVVVALIHKVLYVFSKGNSRALIKREGKISEILQGKDELSTASGFLKDNDCVIIETKEFAEKVNDSSLAQALTNPNLSDSVETLAPQIHTHQQGGPACFLISYKEASVPQVAPGEQTIQEIIQENSIQEQPILSPNRSFQVLMLKQKITDFFSKIPVPRSFKISHTKKLILSVAVVILVVFTTSIFLAIKKQSDIKTQSMFQAVFDPALKKYDEGQSLTDLNKNVARDDFFQSFSMLQNARGQFQKDSVQEKQIKNLVTKVNNALSSVAGVQAIKLTEAKNNIDMLLSLESKNSSFLYAASDDKTIYLADNSKVESIDKSTQKSKDSIMNKDDWKDIGGLGSYGGNLYLLDKSGEILKYVAQSSGFSKSNYLGSGVSPNFSNATSLAIEGSVFVLLKDGTIVKFTKGQSTNFTLSGLDKPFSNPTRMYTNPDSNTVYILDNGNGRIVVLNKSGVYQMQYQSAQIKQAKDFDVDEKNKKLYVLINEKIWQITLQ